VELDAGPDGRLVRAFAAAMHDIVQHRGRSSGRPLSELGSVLLSPQHAPAGMKRLSYLLRSRR
jgi:hypothetical protein